MAQAQLSANPSPPPSGYSYLYPKTDGKWYMMQPDGTFFEVAAPGSVSAWTTIKKVADETRSANATLTADNTLTVALAAGTAYHIRGKVFISTANATMDFKYGLVYSGTTTAITVRRVHSAAGAVAGTDAENTQTTNALPASISVAATTFGIGFVEFDLVIITNTAGTFSFQWAQDTSNASNIICLRGSYLEYMTT